MMSHHFHTGADVIATISDNQEVHGVVIDGNMYAVEVQFLNGDGYDYAWVSPDNVKGAP